MVSGTFKQKGRRGALAFPAEQYLPGVSWPTPANLPGLLDPDQRPVLHRVQDLYATRLNPGDWVCFNPNGSFFVTSNERFLEVFEPVDTAQAAA